MQIIDNINKTVKDDLKAGIHKGSRMSVAAACFSIYAYQELKKQLEGIDELRFIFTSPTFVTEKASKAQREFYIPRISRESSLYGTEFEAVCTSKTPLSFFTSTMLFPTLNSCFEASGSIKYFITECIFFSDRVPIPPDA